jgi:restriction endonuclease Mrr
MCYGFPEHLGENTVMIDHDVGVTEESRSIIKKIDLDYFIEE